MTEDEPKTDLELEEEFQAAKKELRRETKKALTKKMLEDVERIKRGESILGQNVCWSLDDD